jgi:hypothetical protein
VTRSDSGVPASGAAAGAQSAAESVAASAVGSSVQQPPPVAVLDLVVKAFDTQRYDVTKHQQCHRRVHWASALANWPLKQLATEEDRPLKFAAVTACSQRHH